MICHMSYERWHGSFSLEFIIITCTCLAGTEKEKNMYNLQKLKNVNMCICRRCFNNNNILFVDSNSTRKALHYKPNLFKFWVFLKFFFFMIFELKFSPWLLLSFENEIKQNCCIFGNMKIFDYFSKRLVLYIKFSDIDPQKVKEKCWNATSCTSLRNGV